MMRVLRGLMLCVLAPCALGVAVRDADAAEGGVLDYVPGAPGSFLGLLPPIPGVFSLTQSFYSSPARAYGPNGKPSPLPIKVGTQGVAQRFIFSYPDMVFGARFYQQLILPVVNLDVSAFGRGNGEFGLSNVIVSPFIFSWALNTKNAVSIGADVVMPFGSFDKNSALNVALNYTSIQPVLIYRYLDPEGLTVATSARFLFNTMNDLTRYTSGAAIVSEFEVGYSSGKWRFSAVGSYAEQFQDDRQFGKSVPGGNRYRSFGVGPSISYNFDPIILNINYQFGLTADNTVKSDKLWVNIAVPLYVAPPRGAPLDMNPRAISPGSNQAIVARR